MAGPIAQTFLVNDIAANATNTPGVFVTKVDLFFAQKDDTDPIQVEIREVDPTSNQLLNTVVPFSQTVVESADVSISADGATETTVTFPSPVYLLNGSTYALVVKALRGSPNYELWVAQLGAEDRVSGNRVATQAYTGVLFASSTDKSWYAIENEDLKFRMYVASFTTGSSGTIILKNEDREYFDIANVSADFTTTGEYVHGPLSVVLTSSPTVNAAGYVVGSASGANGNVTSVSSNTVVLNNSYPLQVSTGKFTAGETLTFFHANGLTTGVSGVVHSQSAPNGRLSFYDNSTASNTFMHLANTSGSFTANTQVQGQINGYTARILTLRNLDMDTFNIHTGRLELANTVTSVSGKFATSTSARDATFVSVEDNNNTEFTAQRFLLGNSNEVSGLSGESSVEINYTISSTSKRHSPAIDVRKSSIIAVDNLINNDTTGEDGTSGGNALARYITRTVTLADGQDAEDLKIYLTAYKPADAGISVYYKILNADDSDAIDDVSWVEMTQQTNASFVSDTEDRGTFLEYEYQMPTAKLTGSSGEVQYTNSENVTFTGYKYFALKIVLTTSFTSNPPRVRDLRVIALQI